MMGIASFGGIQKRVCLEWIPDVKVGEYVIVHVGFAISKMNEDEAVKTLRQFELIGNGMEELKIPDPEDGQKLQHPAGERPDAIY